MELLRLLAIESTGAVCGVALIEGGTLLGSVRLSHGQNLSGSLLHATDWLLTRHRLRIEQVDAFAVDVGPGSFTGLKIGVMLAKTWAHALQRSLVGVSAFEACAAIAPAEMPLLVALPARRDALYLQWLSGTTALCAPAMVKQSHLPDWLRSAWERMSETGAQHALPPLVIGTSQAWEWLQPLLPNALFQPIECPDPEGVARVGWQRLQTGETTHPFSLTPLYIQPPSITLPKRASG
jgi:tRNA threonylcarbamoyladenosine biosynthesis protein TsaB